MKVYLATWIGEADQGIVLTNRKASHRLTSYHFIMEQKINEKGRFKRYCRTGKLKRKNED